MFFFFSNRLGCGGSLLLSAVVTALLLLTFGVIDFTGDDTADRGTSPTMTDRSPSPQGSDEDSVVASRCPPDLPTCRTAEGRIAYVERVDPDGDGDAHFVIVDPQGITLPGLTAN